MPKVFASPQSQARDVSDSSRPEVLRPSALPWGIYGCCRDGQRTSCSHSYAPRKSHSLPVRAGRQPGLWGKVPCRAKGTACTLCFSGWDSRLPSWIWSQGAEEQWDGAESLDWPAKPPTHTSCWAMPWGTWGGIWHPRCLAQEPVLFCTSHTESSTCTCK